MDLSSPLGIALRSPLGAHAAEGVTPSALRLALQMFGDSVPKEARGFVRWGTPGSAGAAAGRVHEWWPPSATAAASGWTPVAMHRGAPPHGRATPPFLRDRLTADDALDADENSALAHWGDVSSASTQARALPCLPWLVRAGSRLLTRCAVAPHAAGVPQLRRRLRV